MNEEIQEKINLQITEEEEDRIKEYEIELNTGQSMQAEFTTKKINGVLKGVILSNVNFVDILIVSEGGYNIFEEKQRQGVHYFPLKATALNYKGKQFNYVADDYYLNESLNIVVKGAKNSSIKIIFRYV